MAFTVVARRSGGSEYNSAAETETAALALAAMLRRAGDEWSAESLVLVREGGGALFAGWRGGSRGWQPLLLEPGSGRTALPAQPLSQQPLRRPTGEVPIPAVSESVLPTAPAVAIAIVHDASAG